MLFHFNLLVIFPAFFRLAANTFVHWVLSRECWSFQLWSWYFLVSLHGIQNSCCMISHLLSIKTCFCENIPVSKHRNSLIGEHVYYPIVMWAVRFILIHSIGLRYCLASLFLYWNGPVGKVTWCQSKPDDQSSIPRTQRVKRNSHKLSPDLHMHTMVCASPTMSKCNKKNFKSMLLRSLTVIIKLSISLFNSANDWKLHTHI